MRAKRIVGTPEERFWPKVEITPGCWLWTAAKNIGGYGQFHVKGVCTVAHRFSYKLFVGDIVPGMQLDHLCRVRHCVKPDHLEAVTPLENMHRIPTHQSHRTCCAKGHPYTEPNTYYRASENTRVCRRCQADWALRKYHQRKAEKK